jgi:hypothetical protein
MKRRVGKSLLLITLAVLLSGGEAFAQRGGVFVVPPPQELQGIGKTRAEFMVLLEQYPPKLLEVLQTDHSLLSNESYLAPYSELRGFLQRHPEIIRDPDYFLGSKNRESELQELRERVNESYRRQYSLVEDILDTLVPLSIFFVVIAALMWIVRSVADHRRWLRVWRAQSEVHSKLMDRMTNNEELLAYLQSPAGKRYFESAVMPVDPGPRPSNVPAGRIMWSVQVGLVLLLGGLALQLVKGDSQLSPDDVSALRILSVLGIGLGISFVAGAFTSYMISAKLGLLEQPVRRPPSNVEPPMST